MASSSSSSRATGKPVHRGSNIISTNRRTARTFSGPWHALDPFVESRHGIYSAGCGCESSCTL